MLLNLNGRSFYLGKIDHLINNGGIVGLDYHLLCSKELIDLNRNVWQYRTMRGNYPDNEISSGNNE